MLPAQADFSVRMPDVAAIGVDIGGTHVRAARVSAIGEVLAWVTRPTAGQASLVATQINELVQLLDDASVSAIGVGVPGRVDARQGRVLSGGYVDLAGLPLADLLAGATQRPVFVDNDGNMALFAEHAIGAARSAGTAVMFAIGTGIGGAVIVDGTLLRGRAAAGQLGHITVDGRGKPCLCGRRGCVETTSSGTALGRHIAEAGLPSGTSAEMLLARSTNGDAVAKAVLADWAGPMRVAIDTAVAAFDPDVVVLGGGLGAAMHRALAGFPAEAEWYRCAVAAASLGDRAGAIGAGLSALAQRAGKARLAP
jgi:glucokinase